MGEPDIARTEGFAQMKQDRDFPQAAPVILAAKVALVEPGVVNLDLQKALAPMQKLACYWATEYDWRKVESRLNALPQFITEIDGLDIHFIHQRSSNPNAFPLIITHGWPGSIVEFHKVIEPLADPVAHGGQPWQDLTTFEAVAIGVGGVDFYKKALVQLDPATLASFDPRAKVCSMNCGPQRDDPRTREERLLLCDECYEGTP